jgi:enterochelin esterase-like enzyme
MKISRLVGFAAALVCCAGVALGQPPQPAAPAAGAQAGPGRGAAGPRTTSPEILPDNRVTFRLMAPRATEVVVNGDWPGGRGIRMTKEDSGVWSVTTGPLEPELWCYSFGVDGVKAMDPGNAVVVHDTTDYKNPLFIPGPGSALYKSGDVPHGTVQEVWYPSVALKAPRRLTVYTPPGYEGSVAKYPTLYLWHGGSEDEDSWNIMGVTNTVLDNMIAQGKIKPMIVVTPNANWNNPAGIHANGVYPYLGRGGAQPAGAARGGQPAAAAPAGAARGGQPAAAAPGGGQNYDQTEEETVKAIIPFVEARFRALTGRENRAIAGLSMGGGISINVGLKRLDTFAWVGEFSSGMFGGVGGYAPFDVEKISPGFLKDPAATNKKLKALYFSCGADDPRMPFQTKVVEELRSKGIALTFRSFPGAHEWRVWRASLVDFAPMLFR